MFASKFCKWYLILLLILPGRLVYGQDCPFNIGFENSDFSGWETAEGSLERDLAILTMFPAGPTPGRHTIFANTYPGELDPYGLFPVNCPNGSDYSIRLGNDINGREAESIAYTFVVPPDRNDYSIIYQYAVVVQDPNHPYAQLPKLSVTVTDVTGGGSKVISCGSFAYTSSDLPGLMQSEIGEDVFYKPWSAVTINLSGYAGKRIKLEFLTTDCSQGGHFGYAYIDVSEACASPVTGNIYCKDTKDITLIAPFGLQEYKWYTADFRTLLGSQNTLFVSPAPANNTRYALEITPFPGFGCKDTLFTDIKAINEVLTLRITDPPIGCSNVGVDLTDPDIVAGSSPDMKYTYFTDPRGLTYIPTPKFITRSGTYYIKAINQAGCTDIKPVNVIVSEAPELHITAPKAVCFPATVNIAAPEVMGAQSGVSYTFWADGNAVVPLQNPQAVTATGTYYIKATNEAGCFDIKPVMVIIEFVPVLKVNDPPPGCGSVDITQPGITSGSPAGLRHTYWRDADARVAIANPGRITESGVYYIRGATPAADCYDIKPVNVTVYPLPDLNVNDPAPVNYPSVINLDDLFIRRTGDIYSYWTDPEMIQALPDHTSISRSGTFYIRAENQFNCFVVKPVKVVINIPSQPEIFVPKAFAPMQQVNNRLYPILFDINRVLKFAVYNRWGVKVFETNDPTPENGWDGTHDNIIQFLETYTWYAEGVDINGKRIKRSGNTLLVR